MAPSSAADEEDDYMNMTFEESAPSKKNETLTQKKKRLARQAEQARPKSKAEVAEEERKKRDEALNKNGLDTSSKGYKMMAALGYKAGSALGASRPVADGEKDPRLLEPIGLEMKDSRAGIGADSEKKRKFTEEVEAQQEVDKKRKVDAVDFRERQQKEREDKRAEGQMWGAMKVCERLEEEEEAKAEEDATGRTPKRTKPLQSVNVLWRTLVKQRAINERDRRMRYDLHQSLSRRPDYNDPEEDGEEQMAFAKKPASTEEEDVSLDEEDEELDQFQGLEASEKLDKLVAYLRERWKYCFWCKYGYPDEEMDGCPGTTEEAHD